MENESELLGQAVDLKVKLRSRVFHQWDENQVSSVNSVLFKVQIAIEINKGD